MTSVWLFPRHRSQRTFLLAIPGSQPLTVSRVSTTSADTSWTGDPLPWQIAVGASKNVRVSILLQTTYRGPSCGKSSSTRTAGVFDPGNDRVRITGLVSAAQPVHEIPALTVVSTARMKTMLLGISLSGRITEMAMPTFMAMIWPRRRSFQFALTLLTNRIRESPETSSSGTILAIG